MTEKLAVAAYVGAMSKELAELSRTHGLAHLALMLEVAAVAAATAHDAQKDQQNNETVVA